MEIIGTIFVTLVVIFAAVWTSYSFYQFTLYLDSTRKPGDPEKDMQRRNREKFHRKMKAGNVIVEDPIILGQKIRAHTILDQHKKGE